MNKPRNSPTDTALRNALQSLAADIAHHHTPPPASTVWLRSQRRARQLAIARATLPLRIMSAIALITAAAAAIFAAYQSSTISTTTPSTARLLLNWSAPTLALLLTAAWLLIHARRDEPKQEARS